MIEQFRHKGLKRFWQNDDRSKLPSAMIPRIGEILTLLNAANAPEALDIPPLDLHQLKGDRQGQWAVTVRANWRITFRFEDGNAVDIDFVDYH
jgi:proteic killer suppression protein